MRALFLGGTGFVGRHLVTAWRAAGHHATLFNRGLSDREAFPDVEWITGDRERDLSEITKRAGSWDFVFDTSGYLPRVVRASVEAAGTAKYVFVSTISVYSDFTQSDEETAPVREHATPEDLALALPVYGELKVACERVLPAGSLVARPGIILGPHDYDARFRYWLDRIARGGEVLAPGNPEALAQFIDARDMGAWLTREHDRTGAFNLVCEPFTMRELLETIRDVVGSDARFTWVPDEILLEANVQPYSEMPFWLPAALGARPVVTTRAKVAGLVTRPMRDTIADTWAWLAEGWEKGASVRAQHALKVPAGLDAEKEKALLARHRG